MKKILLTIFLVGGCSAAPTSTETVDTHPVEVTQIPEPVEKASPSPLRTDLKEIGHGLVEGYLGKEDYPDTGVLLAPPPAAGSAAQKLDDEVAAAMVNLNGTPRFRLAKRDANLKMDDAVTAYSCVMQIPISQAETPHIYQLMQRSLADAGLSSYGAKNKYQRKRPFMVNNTPTCTPEEEEALRSDGSYPSGHTSLGYAWALILAEVAPDKSDAILGRGLEFAKSRLVCNVHWNSDVEAGFKVASMAVAKLHANDEFNTMVDAAQAEYQTVAAKGLQPNGDCALEAEALNK